MARAIAGQRCPRSHADRAPKRLESGPGGGAAGRGLLLFAFPVLFFLDAI